MSPNVNRNLSSCGCPMWSQCNQKEKMLRDVEKTQQQPNLSRRSRSDKTSTTQSHNKGPTRLRQKGLQRQNAMAHITLNVLDSTSSLFIQVHKTPDLPVIVHSLSLSHSKFLQQRLDQNYQAQRRKSGIRPRSPSYRSFTIAMSIKILTFYALQIHRSHQNYPPNLLLTV